VGACGGNAELEILRYAQDDSALSSDEQFDAAGTRRAAT